MAPVVKIIVSAVILAVFAVMVTAVVPGAAGSRAAGRDARACNWLLGLMGSRTLVVRIR
jgi:hypothetical protein